MASSPPDEQFFTILAAVLGVPRERLDRDSSRDGVEQWDSLKHMHLVLALEEGFDIEFEDAEVADLSTAGALLDAIVSKREP